MTQRHVHQYSVLLVLTQAIACGNIADASPVDVEEIGAALTGAQSPLGPKTRFYAPPTRAEARTQIRSLWHAGQEQEARDLTKLVRTPHATWFTGGTPAEAQALVSDTVQAASAKHAVPVLVAYNIPYRDCGQASSGGAADSAAYKQWIGDFAAGIGNARAVVILEPDSLGIIPYLTDSCQPTQLDEMGNVVPSLDATPEERYALLNFAVDTLLEQAPNALVYLDGTHSGWLSVGDASVRLVAAGVERAAGFFLNVSNFEVSEQLEKYGDWISSCIAFAKNREEGGWRLGHYDWCASQYYPATQNDFTTWSLSDDWYAANLGTARATTHFVTDTSRNGQGPWTPSEIYPDAQTWCNPPGRGTGVSPTTRTHNTLLDAYLWIKVPGESDGECTRGVSGSMTDPAWGDLPVSAAGEWFPAGALDLASRAQ